MIGAGLGVTLAATWAMAGRSAIGSMPSTMPVVAEELLTCIPSAWSCERNVLKSPDELDLEIDPDAVAADLERLSEGWLGVKWCRAPVLSYSW